MPLLAPNVLCKIWFVVGNTRYLLETSVLALAVLGTVFKQEGVRLFALVLVMLLVPTHPLIR